MSAEMILDGDPSKVNVNGYLKGDLLAANASGALQAFHVGTQAEMVTATPQHHKAWPTVVPPSPSLMPPPLPLMPAWVVASR